MLLLGLFLVCNLPTGTFGKNTTPPVPTTTPVPEIICPIPPCPSDGDVSLIPASGPNNNQQQGTQTVTISGTFFPTDCSKGCVFDPPCDTCEMEVTYYVYFGSDAAGCNFEDQDADACQCTAPSGEDLVRDCGWDGHFFRSKYRCHSIVCQVAPLYGQQPLKIFFKDKACKRKQENCVIYPALNGKLEPNIQLWPLNFTYQAPKIITTIPKDFVIEGGLVTIIGESFGGDSNFIQVMIDGYKQGVPTNPKLYNSKYLSVEVQILPHGKGNAVLQIFIGEKGLGELSNEYEIDFVATSSKTLFAVIGILTACMALTIVVMLLAWKFLPPRYVGRYGMSSSDLRRGLLGDGLDDSHFTILREHVTFTKKLARGAFGSVYKGTWLGTVCAIKQIDVWSLQDLREFLDEANILSKLHHPNIVQLLGVCDSRTPQGGREMLIVMEFLSRGSLTDVLQDPAVDLPDGLKRNMALQAAKGMLYLHSLRPPVLHRDLKSPNLLVQSDFSIKIADFGLSRFRVEYTMTFCGSPKWTAPEVLNGQNYDTAADIWSYGVVLWELLSRKVPYSAGTWTTSRDQSSNSSVREEGGELLGSQVAVKVAREGNLLCIPPTPPMLSQICTDCLLFDPHLRLNFREVVRRLQEAEEEREEAEDTSAKGLIDI